MIIFDSNVWIAGYNKDDTLHEKAAELYFSLEKEPIYVPEYIWIEVSTVLEQKASHQAGRGFLDVIEFGENIHMLYFTKEEAQEFVEFYRSSAPKGLSFVDSTLLLLSKSYRIYTFDAQLEKVIAKR